MRRRLTERDLTRIVRRVINEEMNNTQECTESKIVRFMKDMMGKSGDWEFIVKTIPNEPDFLLLIDPDKKECYCTKEDFAVANGI